MAKNVLPKYWNGSEFEELHIVTKASNVFTNDNKSVQQKIDDFTSHLDDIAINVKQFGAKGDGETDDYTAIQNCIDYAYSSGINRIYIPSGYYYVSQTLRTRNDSVWDRVGIEIYGAGLSTKLSRNKKSTPLDKPNEQASSDDTIMANEPVLAIHSVKNIISNFTITKSKVGIYIGQDPRDTANSSHCHFNRFENIFIQHVGTGIVFRSGYGDYYNMFSKVQIADVNIGIDMQKAFPGKTGVSNRNTFMSCEIDKARAGVIILNGDTNTFDAVHFEGIGGSFSGAVPSVLPDGVETAIYVTYQLNTFMNCVCESNDRDVYDDAYGTNYINNHFNLYNGKFKRGSNSRLGTFIGNGTGGTADGFNLGGLFHQTLNSVSGKGALDESLPAYTTIVMGDLHDKDWQGKKYNIMNYMTPVPTKTYNDSVYYHKRIGRINYVWLKTSVSVPIGEENNPIKLKLPVAPNSYDLSSQFYRGTHRFIAIVKNQVVVARFDHTSDPKGDIIIPPPTGGWNTSGVDGELTDIDLQLIYY